VLKDNYEHEAEKLRTMMPTDEQSGGSHDVDTGLLLTYLLTHSIM